MKISFDIDGTMTNFSKFVFSAEKYFKRKHNMSIVNPNGLEIEDVFDIKNVLIGRGYSEAEAIEETKRITDKYWVSIRFIRFSLLGRFRKGVKNTIKQLKKDGHKIEIDSSRAKTTKSNIVGKIARCFTRWQCKFNGVRLSKQNITFYENDDKKVDEIKNKSIQLLFDDKPEVINEVCKFANVICINTDYNRDIQFPKNVIRIDGFLNDEPIEAIKKLFGDKKYSIMSRKAKSDKYYRVLIRCLTSFVISKFKPIILNADNILKTPEPILYAPNHRSTLDPIVITAVLGKAIHWVALKRFFEGKDSIFNNSKNPVLCKITSTVFKKLEFFPIERKSDNQNALNLSSIRDMSGFLKINSYIGIFGEGTTNKEPDLKDFGKFEDSFLYLAKKNNAWVQPVTILWIKELKLKPKVIINFGTPFKIGEMTVEESMNKFMEIQKTCMVELKKYRDKLRKL
jgi:1-acyl-sn-glycerol-3-phosphate acyltransferase